MVDETRLPDRGHIVAGRVQERFGCLAACHHERHVEFLGDRKDNAAQRIFFQPDFDIGISVAPKRLAIRGGGIGQCLVDAIERDRPSLPAGIINDPTVGQLTFTAHREKIALNPVIAAFVLGDGAANTRQIENLADSRGLGIANDFEDYGPAIDQAGFGDRGRAPRRPRTLARGTRSRHGRDQRGIFIREAGIPGPRAPQPAVVIAGKLLDEARQRRRAETPNALDIVPERRVKAGG